MLKHFWACFVVALIFILFPYIFDFDAKAYDMPEDANTDIISLVQNLEIQCAQSNINLNDYPYWAYYYNPDVNFWIWHRAGIIFWDDDFQPAFKIGELSFGYGIDVNGQSTALQHPFPSAGIDYQGNPIYNVTGGTYYYGNDNSIVIYSNTNQPSFFTVNGDVTWAVIDTTYLTEKADGMLTSFLVSQGFKFPTSARFVNPSDATDYVDIPVVNNGLNPPSDTDFYLKLYTDNYSFRLVPSLTLGASPPTAYRNYLIEYDIYIPEMYELEAYLVSTVENVLHINTSYFIWDNQNITPQTAYYELSSLYGFGTHNFIDTSSVSPAYLTCAYQWWNDGHTFDTNFIVKNYTVAVDDGNGGTTYQDMRSSDTYNNYVSNVVNQTIIDLGGNDYGISNFSADWSGQSVDTSFTYNNDFTFSDTNLQYLFSGFFTSGQGIALRYLLATLSIALAAYVLYGRGG